MGPYAELGRAYPSAGMPTGKRQHMGALVRTGPAIPTNGGHVHLVELGYVDDIVGAARKVKGKNCVPFQRGGVKGRLCWWVRDDKLYGSVLVKHRGGALLRVVACTPLQPIRERVQRLLARRGHQVSGWWSSIKNAGKSISNTVSKIAKHDVTKKLTGLVSNPAFQKFAQAAAPAALSAFGVPPHLTQRAIGLVNQARGGVQSAMAKVRNISQLSQQGYQPAMQLHNVMSTYFRQGMGGIMQQSPMAAWMPQPQQLPQMYPTMQQMYQRMQQMQQMAMPYGGMPQMPYGMYPFSTPRFSGWVYNIPYRGNLAAGSLDKTNPLHVVRAMYSAGLKG